MLGLKLVKGTLDINFVITASAIMDDKIGIMMTFSLQCYISTV